MSFQMPIFSLGGSSSAASLRGEKIVSQIRDASKSDQEKALVELHREAQASEGDEQTWSDLALGLFQARYFENACDLFRKLAEVFPAHDVHRLNVATCLSQMAQLDLCRYELEQVKTHGQTEEGRHTAAELLEGLTQWRGKSARDQQFTSLKMSALRERVEAGEAEPDEYVQLARLLLQQEPGDLTKVEAADDQARHILQQGEKRFPESVPILEHLAFVYFRTSGAEGQLNAIFQKLQRIAPDSPVLQAGQSTTDDDAQAFSKRMRGRAYELMQNCEKRDPPLVEASLRELQKMVIMFAQTPEYRKIYTFALMIAGRKDEAQREAEILAALGDDSHDMHFHLGQIFSACGDTPRGLRHLELALQSARSQEDRDQTEMLIAQCKNLPVRPT
jgi:tetratricopeptide (TPR) repeat protein